MLTGTIDVRDLTIDMASSEVPPLLRPLGYREKATDHVVPRRDNNDSTFVKELGSNFTSKKNGAAVASVVRHDTTKFTGGEQEADAREIETMPGLS